MKSINISKFLCILCFIPLALGISGSVNADGEEVIKLGLVGDLTGPTGVPGSATVRGFEGYINWVNDRGGVNGKKIELLIEDGKYNVPRDIALYRELRQKNVLTVIHTWTTGTQHALAKEYIKDKNVVFPGSHSDFLFHPVNPFIFTSSVSYNMGYRAILDYLKVISKGKKIKFAYVYPDSAFGHDGKDWFEKNIKDYNVVMEKVVLNLDATDATSQVVKIKNSNVDYVVLHLGGRTPRMFIETANRLGLAKPMVLDYNSTDQDLIDMTSNVQTLKNIVGMAFYAVPTEDIPANKLINEIAEKYKIDKKYTLMGWFRQGLADAMLVVEAIKRCGNNITSDNLREKIENIQNFNTLGLTAPITYSAQSHIGTNKVKFIKVNLNKKTWEPFGDWVEVKKGN